MKRCIPALVVSLASLLALTSGSALASAPASGAEPARAYYPPTLTAYYGAASIPVGGHTSLTFKLANAETSKKLVDVNFADTLPSGLVIASPPNLRGECPSYPGPALITAAAGTRYVKLSGLMFDVTVPNSCGFTIDVTGAGAGVQANTTTEISGCIDYPDYLHGPGAPLSINVIAAPAISAVFNPATIDAGGTTYAILTITNPAANPVALTGVGFTATLPAGLSVSGTTAPWCGGTLTLSPPTGISLSGASIATGSPCVITLMFTGVAAGNYALTTSRVASDNGGSGNPATAHLTVRAVATPTPTPTPSEAASASPSETAAASASASASAIGAASPSPVPTGSPAPADSGPPMPLIALGGIVVLGVAGLLIATFVWRKRRGAQSAPPSGT